MRLFTYGVLLLAVTAVACRPDGPTGPGKDSSVSSLTLFPEAAEVPVDGRLHLEATVRDDEGDILPADGLTWTSSDPDVATVDDAGEVTGVALGSVTVTASAEGVEGSATVDVRGFLIGAAGGVATSEDGRAWAAVPAGALSGEVMVVLEPVGGSALPEGGAEAFTPGSAYQLQVGSQPFSPPAQLTVRYDRSAIPSGVPESSLRLARASGEAWARIEGSSVDTGAEEVRGPVDRSGVYGAVGVGNRPPTVEIRDPDHGDAFLWGEEIRFRGRAEDPEDGRLGGGSLVWESSIDGQFGTGESVETKDLSIGNHTVTLTATDSHGATGSDQIRVDVENNPPTATITRPQDGAVFVRGTTITFEGTGTDPEDGTLTGGALVWESSKDGQFGTGRSVTTSSLSNGTHDIILTVTDSHGATGEDQIRIQIIGVF